jgi:RND superfamily putative drug exporter
MSWRGLARLVLRAPGRVLAVSVVTLAIPALGLLDMTTSYDQVSQLPDDSDSVQGFHALSGSFGPGQVQPVVVMARTREKTVWTDDAFSAIDQLTVNLEKVPGVAAVRSITRPTSEGISQQQLEEIGLGDVAGLAKDLPRAIDGLSRAIDGLERMRDGLEQILAQVPDQRASISQGLEGIRRIRDGLSRIIPGLHRIAAGLTEGRDGAEKLATDVADPAVRALEAAWDDLRQTTVGKVDPEYDDLAMHVGEALGLLTGRCPDAMGIGPQPGDCPAGERIDPEYDGLTASLQELATGLGEAISATRRIAEGSERIDAGLARFERGLEAQPEDLDRLETGVGAMISGVERIIPGLGQLRRGLLEGSALIEQATGLVPEPGDEISITASVATAFPEIRRQLTFFTGDHDRATRVFVILDRQPYDPRALRAADQIREIATLSLRESPLRADSVGVTGASPFFADIEDVTLRDIRVVVFAVILGVFLVLVLLLRSLLAPLYLVITVLMSFAATLGLTAFVFQGLLGKAGLVWWLPIFLFVTLVALGADYNIFLMGRIREEATKTDTRSAVAEGLAATGHVITSAGLILAGTFAALLAAPLEGMVQLGFAATVGLLIDTFIVRSLMVPSIAVLVGSASWWPSARAGRA